MKAKRTIFDAELFFLAREYKQHHKFTKRFPMVALGSESVAERSLEASPEKRINLKILTRAGFEAQATEWILQHGGMVHSSGKRVLLAELPSMAVGDMEESGAILRAEAPRHLHLTLDQARGPVTGLDTAQTQFPLSGQGVVMGIIDSGVDWRHLDFRTTGNQTSRLEYFGHYERPDGAQVSTFSHFTQDQINQAIQGSLTIPQGDPNGHGTHCASIAAGNGEASGGTFRGVAPEAAIMAVRSEPLLDNHIIQGIREIFTRAGDRPAVVNLSLGGHWGPHDGTSAIENAIAQETGPGRIVVIAAGNEGGDGIHWEGALQTGEDLIIPIRTANADFQFVDVWVPRGDDVDIKIETPDGAQHDPTGDVVETTFGAFIGDWREDPVNQDQNLTLRMAALPNQVWKIRLIPQQILHGEVHAWGGTDPGEAASQLFPGMTGKEYSLGMPGTEERGIVVGSFVSRTSFPTSGGVFNAPALSIGQLSPFSSHGPTRYGAHKPDLVAPGQFITAALAQGSEFATSPNLIPRHHPSLPYVTIQGTSMATPFVAGVIALMLQREATLTPEEIQQRVRTTAQRDGDTQRVWNPGFGSGKIDVQALLAYGQGPV